MAEIRIADLPTASTIDDNVFLAVDTYGVEGTSKATPSQLVSPVASELVGAGIDGLIQTYNMDEVALTSQELDDLKALLGISSGDVEKLHEILLKIVNRNGTVVATNAIKNVASGGADPTQLCSVVVPTAGAWLIVSNVWETTNSSSGDKVFQNRITSDGKYGSFVRSPQVGRTTCLPNSIVYDLDKNATVYLHTYISTGNATEMYGALWAIKVA